MGGPKTSKSGRRKSSLHKHRPEVETLSLDAERSVVYDCGDGNHCYYEFGKSYPLDPIEEEVVAFRLCEKHKGKSGNNVFVINVRHGGRPFR